MIMENHGCLDSVSSRAWTSLSEAETALHAHSSNHAWRCMRSTWRPSRQWGLRVAQVTGACDHIKFQARCRMGQGTHVRGGMGGAWRCMAHSTSSKDALHSVWQRRLSMPNWQCIEGAPICLKGYSCDGGVRSYQVPSKRQGTHVRGDMGGAWECMGPIHRDLCTALSVDDTAIHAHLSNHAWQWHGEHMYKMVGACALVRSCKARQGTPMRVAWKSFASTLGSLDISPPPLPTPPLPPISAGGL